MTPFRKVVDRRASQPVGGDGRRGETTASSADTDNTADSPESVAQP